LIPVERIQQAILLIRGQKVLLDKDLATLYQVSTSNLNKAVSRNFDRFPEDFMFQLTKKEFKNLKFHFGTSKDVLGGRKIIVIGTENGFETQGLIGSRKAAKVAIKDFRR